MATPNNRGQVTNEHPGNSDKTLLKILSASNSNDSNESWNRLIELLERLLPENLRTNGLSKEDFDDIRSEILVRILTIVLDDQFRIRVSIEAWLRAIIGQEIRAMTNRKKREASFMQSLDPAWLASCAIWTDRSERDTEESADQTKSVMRKARSLAKLLESANRQISSQSWELFWDITVNETPLKVAAIKYGLSYSGAHKSYSRTLNRILKIAKESGFD